MTVGSCDLSLAEKKIIVVYKESTQVVLLRESDQIGFSGLLAKYDFQRRPTYFKVNFLCKESSVLTMNYGLEDYCHFLTILLFEHLDI